LRFDPQGPAHHAGGSKIRGFALPLAERTLAVYDQASAKGAGAKDCTELPAFWSSHHNA
jgi:hypothetical protein